LDEGENRILKDENESCTFQNPEGTVDRLYCTFRILEWEIQPGEGPPK
jgi:hypothetical protein